MSNPDYLKDFQNQYSKEEMTDMLKRGIILDERNPWKRPGLITRILETIKHTLLKR